MKLKGKLIKFVDNCKGSVEISQSEIPQMALFDFRECIIAVGETGIVLEEEIIGSISQTFINALIGDRVVYDIRISGDYGLAIEVCS